MPDIICSKCGKRRHVTPRAYRTNKSGNFFCSQKCSQEWYAEITKSHRVTVKCHTCGKEITKIKSQAARNKTGRFYCPDCNYPGKITPKPERAVLA